MKLRSLLGLKVSDEKRVFQPGSRLLSSSLHSLDSAGPRSDPIPEAQAWVWLPKLPLCSYQGRILLRTWMQSGQLPMASSSPLTLVFCTLLTTQQLLHYLSGDCFDFLPSC